MKRRAIASLLAVGALVVGGIAAGCGDDDDSGSATSGGGGGDVSDLKLGVLVPLTGQLADFGGPGSTAANLAADQLNTAGTANDFKVTLVTEDTKTDPQAAQEAATKVIESDGVAAIAGPWGTPELIPTVENVTVDAGIPIVTPSATGPDITDLDDDGLVARTPPSDAIQGKVLAQVVADALGQGKTVNTASRNDSYGDALVGEFTTAYEALGGKVGKNVSYNPDAASLNSEAQQIASGQPRRLGDHRLHRHVAEARPGAGAHRQLGPGQDVHRRRPAVVRAADGRGQGDHRGHARHGADVARRPGRRGVRRALEGAGERPPPELRRAELRRGDPARARLARRRVDRRRGHRRQRSQDVSGPPGTKYTFEQLSDAIAALKNGEDIDYEGASGPIDLDENGDPSAANYGTWSYTGGKLVDSDEVIPVTEGG